MHRQTGEHLRREAPAWGSECGRWRGRQGTRAGRTGLSPLQSSRGAATHRCHFVRAGSRAVSSGRVTEVGNRQLRRAVPRGTPPRPRLALRVAPPGRWSVPLPGTCAVHAPPWACGPRGSPSAEAQAGCVTGPPAPRRPTSSAPNPRHPLQVAGRPGTVPASLSPGLARGKWGC